MSTRRIRHRCAGVVQQPSAARPIFVAVLGMDRLATPEGEAPAVDRELHIASSDQVHFDPSQHVAPSRLVAEGIKGNVGAKFPIDAAKQVEIERGRDARLIVVRIDEPTRVFLQVDADDQAA